jgi:xylulokinase
MDAEAAWWTDVAALSRELMAGMARHALAGICVSGIGPCLLMCDQDDRPLRPAIRSTTSLSWGGARSG